jgi:glycosyltransferase involved in cell wall biosynthesis
MRRDDTEAPAAEAETHDRLRIVLATHNAYSDPASGAARSVRTMMSWLADAGNEVRVLGTARLDGRAEHAGEAQFDPLRVPVGVWEFPACEVCPVTTYASGGVQVTSILTRHNDPARPDRGESQQFLSRLDDLLDWFRPDLLISYGAHPVVYEALRRAKARRIVTVFYLCNHGYEDLDWFRHVDHVLADSPYLARKYRAEIGLDCSELGGAPFQESDVISSPGDRQFVTFVNPTLHKGGAFFVRLAEVLCSRRSDIPLLVALSTTQGATLRFFPEVDLARFPQIVTAPAFDRPAEIHALTRILLMPSVFDEPFGRLAAEALLNGIPPLVSDRGGLAETVAGGGFVLPLPDWMTPTARRLPSASDVEPWVALISQLWADRAFYQKACDTARRAGMAAFGEDRQRPRYVAWFRSIVHDVKSNRS